MWRTPFPMHGGFGAGRGLMFCGGLLLVGLLVILVVWLILAAQRRGRMAEAGAPVHRAAATGPTQAVQIARERYAHGEISREEFMQIQADLEGPPAPPPQT